MLQNLSLIRQLSEIINYVKVLVLSIILKTLIYSSFYFEKELYAADPLCIYSWFSIQPLLNFIVFLPTSSDPSSKFTRYPYLTYQILTNVF